MGYVELDRRDQGLFQAKNENSGLQLVHFQLLGPSAIAILHLDLEKLPSSIPLK